MKKKPLEQNARVCMLECVCKQIVRADAYACVRVHWACVVLYWARVLGVCTCTMVCTARSERAESVSVHCATTLRACVARTMARTCVSVSARARKSGGVMSA